MTKLHMSSVKDRIPWIDQWRGLLIFLVVFGHVVGGGCHLAQGQALDALKWIFKSIYMFHMPAFAFIAGMLWHEEKSFVRFSQKRAVRLLVPYFIFGVFSIALYAVFSSPVATEMRSAGTDHYRGIGQLPWYYMFASLLHGGGWPNGEGFRANSVLWFLPCMFSAQIIYYWVDRIIRNRWCQLCFAFVLLTCWQYIIPRGISLPFGLSRAPEFVIFMVAGRWLLPENWRKARCCDEPILKQILLVLGLVIAYVALVYAFGRIWQDGCFTISDHYALALTAYVGILVSLQFCRQVRFPGLKAAGLMSMGIMLMHKPLVVAVQYKVSLIQSAFKNHGALAVIGSSIILAIAVTLLCMAISWPMIRYIPFVLGEKGKEQK